MKVWSLVLLLVSLLITAQPALAQKKYLPGPGIVPPRMRVIIDNDFGGDPDGLFQLVHQVLSPSAEIRAIIGSHLKPGDGFDPSGKTATNAANAARTLLTAMNMSDQFQVVEGSNKGLENIRTPIHSEGAKAIVQEAMRNDTQLPLYVVCGAGLTEIASALLMEPKIADRLTLVWIGGPEYAGLALPPPGYTPLEYNLGIDIIAAQVVFNHTEVAIWQVPRNVYRQALVSYAELLQRIKPQGKTGAYLVAQIEKLMQATQKFKLLLGETYILGDSPLVLLTALQSSFEADPSSSKYVLRQAPGITDAGLYAYDEKGRNIRVFDQLDTRTMLEDLYAKLALFNLQQ